MSGRRVGAHPWSTNSHVAQADAVRIIVTLETREYGRAVGRAAERDHDYVPLQPSSGCAARFRRPGHGIGVPQAVFGPV
jgi:hypothetical protein